LSPFGRHDKALFIKELFGFIADMKSTKRANLMPEWQRASQPFLNPARQRAPARGAPTDFVHAAVGVSGNHNFPTFPDCRFQKISHPEIIGMAHLLLATCNLQLIF